MKIKLGEKIFNLTIVLEDDFNSFFDKEKEKEKGILGKEFNNPEEFEKNFNFYIKDYEIYKNKPFKFYDNKARQTFILELNQNIICSTGKLYSYFGQSGIGKTISVLGASKYIINHKKYGTLYLNMKCLNLLLRDKQYLQFRQIIIDEIPYLFYENYDDYVKCVNKIEKFCIENEDSVWELISEIIAYIFGIEAKRKYFLILDQYNSKIDKNGNLHKINDEFIQNKNKNKNRFGIITFSSMNNRDIKDYKIYLIKKEFNQNSQNKKNMEDYKEIEIIFDKNELKFENDEIDEYYDSLGRNIKYYNILDDYYNNNKNMENSINEIKENIKKKIKIFYDCDLDEKNIDKLLHFSTDTKYNLDQFLEVVIYIPFKYFIPRVEKEKEGKKYIQIYFAFPLIEEIINEFLESIIYFELNIYKKLCETNDIDGGARGQMFEKFVTHHLTPNINDPKRKIFFEDVRITDTISLQKFIPRKNEKKIREKKKKIKLKNGTYLFTQKILNGKSLDILIITIDEKDKAKIIQIQISIHKPIQYLFINSYLKDICISLKENLNKQYTFTITNHEMFFTYIFDKSYEKIQPNEFRKMIDMCEFNNVAYMLFAPDDINFYDGKGKIIKSLGEVVKCPYKPSTYRFECDDSDIIKDVSLTFPKEKFGSFNDIQPFEIQLAIKILKNDTEKGDKIKNLIYSYIKVIQVQSDFDKNRIYFSRRNEDKKAFIIYFSKKRQIFYDVVLEENNEGENILLKGKSYYNPIFDEYKYEYEDDTDNSH